MTDQQTPANQIGELVIDTVSKSKPTTTDELVRLIQQKSSLSEKEILTILRQLEEENKIHFAKKTAPDSKTFGPYLFSLKSLWLWLSIIIAIATAVAVFAVPENNYPLLYLRQILGSIFVLFLPGFVFLKTLYPSKVPVATSSENLGTIERISLSIGLSIALTAVTGLILNYSPWGIRLLPVTLSLLALTLIFATSGIIREYQAKSVST